jgi:hypothetical protein
MIFKEEEYLALKYLLNQFQSYSALHPYLLKRTPLYWEACYNLAQVLNKNPKNLAPLVEKLNGELTIHFERTKLKLIQRDLQMLMEGIRLLDLHAKELKLRLQRVFISICFLASIFLAGLVLLD